MFMLIIYQSAGVTLHPCQCVAHVDIETVLMGIKRENIHTCRQSTRRRDFSHG